jgi:hypothetical protein
VEKDVSSRAQNIGFELPTARAELTILLVDVPGRAEPVRWSLERRRLVSWRRPAWVHLRRRMARRAATARAGEFLTALYLEAEQNRLPHEPPYDVDLGLRRFSTWLDDEAEPRDETSC